MLLVFDIPPSLSAQSLSLFLTHTNMQTHMHTHTKNGVTLIKEGKMLLCLNCVQSSASNLANMFVTSASYRTPLELKICNHKRLPCMFTFACFQGTMSLEH